MTPARQLHPQRCETCEIWDTDKCPLRKDVSKNKTSRYNLRHVTEGVGCASHSSTPAPAPDGVTEWECDACDNTRCTYSVNYIGLKNYAPDKCPGNMPYYAPNWRIHSRPYTSEADEIAERQKEWSVVTKEIYEKGKVAGAKAAREQVLVKAIRKIRGRIALNITRGIKEGFEESILILESLRAQPENTSSKEE